MKKSLFISIGLALIAGAAYLVISKKDSVITLLGQDPKLYSYIVDGVATGQFNITVPFVENSTDDYTVAIAIDGNGDEQISDDEWQIKDAPVYLLQNLKSNFWLTYDTNQPDVREILVKIDLRQAANGELNSSVEKKLLPEPFEIGELFGFSVAGASEDLKRGIGFPNGVISVAYAEGEEVFREGMTPDLAQGRMECAAVSAANNLMSLAGENEQLDKLPAFTGELIEELKRDMKFKNGITLPNMVTGKNAFTARHQLPISTELKLAPTKEDILAALNSGAAVELSFSFVNSRSGRKNTGHVVTLVGASKSSLFVHDSGTPEGMDTLAMHGTVQTPKHTYINVPYPLWDGVAYVDGIVVQNWTEPKHATESYTDAGDQASEVEMLVINGHYFPKSFFRVAPSDKCNANHYHAVAADDTVYGLKDKNSLEVVSLKDPSRNACGFGKVSEVPVEKITNTFEQSQALLKYLPN